MIKAVNKFAHVVAENQGLSNEQEAVIAYGMLAACQMIIIVFLAAAGGLLLNIVFQSLAICFSVGILRKFTGGAHGKSMLQCVIISVGSILVMATISWYILAAYIPVIAGIVFTVFSYSAVYAAIYLKAPVASVNKPITSAKKIKRLRKSAFLYISVLLVSSTILIIFGIGNNSPFLLSINYSICLSLLWQGATLTPIFSLFAD